MEQHVHLYLFVASSEFIFPKKESLPENEQKVSVSAAAAKQQSFI